MSSLGRFDHLVLVKFAYTGSLFDFCKEKYKIQSARNLMQQFNTHIIKQCVDNIFLVGVPAVTIGG